LIFGTIFLEIMSAKEISRLMEWARCTDDELADIFTKPLDESRFCKLRNELNVIDISNVAWELAHVFIHMHLFISLIYF
jgi:hypothetical protein